MIVTFLMKLVVKGELDLCNFERVLVRIKTSDHSYGEWQLSTTPCGFIIDDDSRGGAVKFLSAKRDTGLLLLFEIICSLFHDYFRENRILASLLIFFLLFSAIFMVA